MDVVKNFLFLKIDFKSDIIRTKIWFPYGKRLLADNMTGHTYIQYIGELKYDVTNIPEDFK